MGQFYKAKATIGQGLTLKIRAALILTTKVKGVGSKNWTLVLSKLGPAGVTSI